VGDSDSLLSFTDVECSAMNNMKLRRQKLKKLIVPPYGWFLVCTQHLDENSSLASHFPIKILAFVTSQPLEISNDHPWGRHEYFLELQS